MTYCTVSCEMKANGVTIEDILAVQRFPWSELLAEVSSRRIAV